MGHDLKEYIRIQLGVRDAILIGLLMLIILTSTLPLYFLVKSLELSFINVPLLIAIVLIMTFLHETIHILSMISFGIKGIRPRIVSKVGIPLALMILYDEMSIGQYIVTALSPQLISLILVIMTLYYREYLITWFYVGHLGVLSYILLTCHLAMSAGDIYGVALTLSKARGLKGRIKCIIDDKGLREILIYPELRTKTRVRKSLGDSEDDSN